MIMAVKRGPMIERIVATSLYSLINKPNRSSPNRDVFLTDTEANTSLNPTIGDMTLYFHSVLSLVATLCNIHPPLSSKLLFHAPISTPKFLSHSFSSLTLLPPSPCSRVPLPIATLPGIYISRIPPALIPDEESYFVSYISSEQNKITWNVGTDV